MQKEQGTVLDGIWILLKILDENPIVQDELPASNNCSLNCMLPNNCSITVFICSIVEGFGLSRIGLFKMLYSVTNVRT